MTRRTLIAILLFLFCLPATGHAQDAGQPLQQLRSDNLAVAYPDGLEAEARHIIDIYPSARARLIENLGLPANVAHTVVIAANNENFVRATGSNLIVAFAEGSRRLVVLDYAALAKRPSALPDTLTHELCHLVLHEYVTSGPNPQGASLLPRWLNEGICQWASGGINEMAALGQASEIENAVLGDRLVPLRHLERTFPGDNRGMMLAYEESLSAVQYIVERQGRDALLDILKLLRQGHDIDFAIGEALGMTYTQFEEEWQSSLRLRHTWLTWLSNNILSLLFAAAGGLLVLGFLRAVWRYWRYRDDDEFPDDPPAGPSPPDVRGPRSPRGQRPKVESNGPNSRE